MRTKKSDLLCLLAIAFFASGCAMTRPFPSGPKPPRRSLDIQRLIDESKDGSTITIPFGEYRLSKGLEIRGRKNLILTCGIGTRILVEDTNANVLSISRSEGIEARNLYFRHVKPREEYECHGAVVRLEDSKDVAIVNSELNGCGAIGVAASLSRNIVIENCFVHHNTFNAFYFQGCGDVKIRSTIIEDNGNFIQMYDTESLEMQDNIIRRNGGYWKSFHDPNPGLKMGSANKSFQRTEYGR